MLRNGLEPWHLLIVAIVVILLFGSKKLPDTARALGKSMRILKSEARAIKDDDAAQSTAAPTEDTTASSEPAPRLIRTRPDESATARPATENRRAH
ncbi:Sec-independent protein translocase subunit TatA [Streptomyces sp. NPDC052036]|uniref:Sec-independent protein translocase subunit TatA n=1 Tax=unclassified Streptomyces TaxID=2593676 RepID=UPI0034135C15